MFEVKDLISSQLIFGEHEKYEKVPVFDSLLSLRPLPDEPG